jgi:predicted dehydrogenase
MVPSGMNRRDFVAASSAALGTMIVPRHVLGGVGYQPPSRTVNVAIVGAGGMGMSNAEELLSENIVALCDVDFGYVDRQVETKQKEGNGTPRPKGIRLKEAFSKAARYADYRVMLEKQKDIDAVLIATPDHNHAVIAHMAMNLGKHVYVQKPLATTVHETRVLRETAAATGVVTQMGNQGHSTENARLINEWIAAGMIGPVREVYIWTNRPIWPQGIPRPNATAPTAFTPPTGWGSGNIRDATANALAGNFSPPPGMNWDLYLGPVPEVPYHPIYHPFNWRGWVDFGVGALGDMGAHLVDHPYWALGLTYPTSIEASSTPFGGSTARPATYPISMTANYEFPARGMQPPVKMHWYDGGLQPPRPAMLPDSVVLSREGGVMYIGDWGLLLHETYGNNPRLYPEGIMEAARAVPKTLPRVHSSHEMNWIAAIRGEARPSSPFEYAAPLTEVMLLGIAALRAGQGRKVYYDAAAMTFTNAENANRFLTREYRAGWGL